MAVDQNNPTPFEQVRDLIDRLGDNMPLEAWVEFLGEIVSDVENKMATAEGELRLRDAGE